MSTRLLAIMLLALTSAFAVSGANAEIRNGSFSQQGAHWDWFRGTSGFPYNDCEVRASRITPTINENLSNWTGRGWTALLHQTSGYVNNGGERMACGAIEQQFTLPEGYDIQFDYMLGETRAHDPLVANNRTDFFVYVGDQSGSTDLYHSFGRSVTHSDCNNNSSLCPRWNTRRISPSDYWGREVYLGFYSEGKYASSGGFRNEIRGVSAPLRVDNVRLVPTRTNTNAQLTTGFWQNPNDPYSGVHFSSASGSVYAIWATFNSQGDPIWFTTTGGQLRQGTMSSRLNATSIGSNGQPVLRNVGSLSVRMVANGKAIMSWNITDPANRSNGSQLIELTSSRSVLGGQWFDPRNNGWGVGFSGAGANKNDALVFGYRNNQPTWWHVALNGNPYAGVSGQVSEYRVQNACPGCSGPVRLISARTPAGSRFDVNGVASRVPASVRIGGWQEPNAQLHRLTR